MKPSRIRQSEHEGAFRYYSSRLRERCIDAAGALVLAAQTKRGQPPCMICSPDGRPCKKCLN